MGYNGCCVPSRGHAHDSPKHPVVIDIKDGKAETCGLRERSTFDVVLAS